MSAPKTICERKQNPSINPKVLAAKFTTHNVDSPEKPNPDALYQKQPIRRGRRSSRLLGISSSVNLDLSKINMRVHLSGKLLQHQFPFIRLISALKFCSKLAFLITILVPNKKQCQEINFNNNDDLLWAKRILNKSPSQPPLGRQDIPNLWSAANGFAAANQQAASLFDGPKTRLRGLVNNRMADLQAAAIMWNQSKHQQALPYGQQLSASSQHVSPTINKLYSFLFPNSTSKQASFRQQLNTTNEWDSFNSTEKGQVGEPLQSASSNEHRNNLYLASERQLKPNHRESTTNSVAIKLQQPELGEKQRQQQVISLSAPYESRARASFTSSLRSNLGSESSANERVNTYGSLMSGRTDEGQLMDSSAVLQSDLQAENEPMDSTFADANNHIESTSSSPQGYLVEDSNEPDHQEDQIGQHHFDSNGSPVPNGDLRSRQEIYLTGSQPNHRPQQVVDSSSHLSDLPEMQQFGQIEPDSDQFNYYATNNKKSNDNLTASDSHYDEITNTSNNDEAQGDELIAQAAGQQKLPVDGHLGHDADHYGQHEQEQLGSNSGLLFNGTETSGGSEEEQSNGGRLINHSGQEFGLEEFASSRAGGRAFKGMFPMSANDSSNNLSLAADESYLTAQLPATYDAVIRMPPEGYYDDYFKPAQSDVQTQQANELSHQNNQQASFDDRQISNGSYGQLQRPYEPLEGANSNATGKEYANLNNKTSVIRDRDSDYTRQFYLSQQPLRQNNEFANPSVDFLVPNGTAARFPAHNQKVDQFGYELPPPSGAGQESSGFIGGNVHTNNGTKNEMEPDNLQLIMANTNSSRDPLSNEKVINYYTSEGRNVTRLSGRQVPRNTFVNKDMNEYPATNEAHLRQPPARIEAHTKSLAGQSPAAATAAGDEDGLAYGLGSQQQQQQEQQDSEMEHDQVERPSGGGNRLLGERAKHVAAAQQDSADLNEEDELKRLAAGSRYGGRREMELAANRGQQGSSSLRLPTDANREQVQQQRHEIKRVSNEGRNLRQQSSRNVPANHQANERQRDRTRSPSFRASQKGKTMNRPQVTEANFSPKDLIMNPPTPQPAASSITESAIESIAELPSKVKRLRTNQPDKNELMSELLAALDRVKVAIYKLQPLTAKMNAIYRKSVTSNTRDIIMDNYKGTYAKRYPPGDYDDTYDRMHPSDLLNHLSSRSAGQRANERDGAKKGGGGDSAMEASESATSAIYLPAPKGLLSRFNGSTRENSTQMEPLDLDESQIVATGIGRRLGSGRVSGQLELTGGSGDLLSNQEKNISHSDASKANSDQRSMIDSAAPSFVPPEQLASDETDSAGPLFGYRITIFQSPDDSNFDRSQDDDLAAANQPYAYQIDGLDANSSSAGIELIGTSDSIFQPTREGPNEKDSNVEGGEEDAELEEDIMATSESSVVLDEESSGDHLKLMAAANSSSISANATSSGADTIEGSESSSSSMKKSQEDEEKSKKKAKKKHKSGHEEGEKKSKGVKEKEEKKREKSKKSMMRNRKKEEESKKKKEYKKIKHNKEIEHKEKKTMHRDKHIKAHDRGAAKEKALKERTQIEFFEREQIVDDEFEKAKKSITKAGWQSGKDSKKTLKGSHGGADGAGAASTPAMDMLQPDGSHFVEHKHPSKEESKVSGVSVESASAKKTNKYEKKKLEAKGKKFKGWREKGYKIITETEFIDRGSLHDSAYKKRDKGAAHHQKYKKQETSSEGHQGSMQVVKKKMQKKEDKKLKMHEKKEKHMKKKEEEKKEKKKREKKMEKKKEEKEEENSHGDKSSDHEHGESNPMAAIEPANILELEDKIDRLVVTNGNSRRLSNGQDVVGQPIVLAAMSGPANSSHRSDNLQLTRLLSGANYTKNQHQVKQLLPIPAINLSGNATSSPNNNLIRAAPIHSNLLALNDSLRTNSMATTNRRSDSGDSVQLVGSSLVQPIKRLSSNNSSSLANATILDIVDNLTGRQVNKTKIGTYELEDHHTIRLANAMLSNSSATPANGVQVKLSPTQAGNSKSGRDSPASVRLQQTQPVAGSTVKPLVNVPQPIGKEKSDSMHLLDLIKQANIPQKKKQQQQQQWPGKLMYQQSGHQLNPLPVASGSQRRPPVVGDEDVGHPFNSLDGTLNDPNFISVPEQSSDLATRQLLQHLVQQQNIAQAQNMNLEFPSQLSSGNMEQFQHPAQSTFLQSLSPVGAAFRQSPVPFPARTRHLTSFAPGGPSFNQLFGGSDSLVDYEQQSAISQFSSQDFFSR